MAGWDCHAPSPVAVGRAKVSNELTEEEWGRMNYGYSAFIGEARIKRQLGAGSQATPPDHL